MKIYEDILQTIGNTPLVKIKKIAKGSGAAIFAKLEYFNPLSSVKDRIAFSMISDGEEKGLINKDTVIIEPTSGNTGIGLAMVCAVKGYKLKLVMPDTMSVERRKILSILGAEIVLTQGTKGMAGAVEKAEELIRENKNSFMPQQFKNIANPLIHKKTTALEIWNDLDGKIDIFIAGVGTGGTLTGVGEVLKEKNADIKIIAVEPKDSPVLSGGTPGPHKIQGIGAGFVPEVLNKNIIDEIIQVSNEEAVEYAGKLARLEGILAGISGGAAIHAGVIVSRRQESKNKNIVVIIPDTGERYLSII
ncbi:cysteine synthase A [bacterium]